MYARSAAYYDAVYAAIGKDYEHEAARVHTLITQHKRSPGNALLDVACGTGGHLVHLRRDYAVEGLDASPQMLALAGGKLPGVILHQGEMTRFDLPRRYDAIVCLFSAIGYAVTLQGLRQAVATMARHVAPGGVVVIEPWLEPDAYREGLAHAVFVDRPDLKLARMNVSRRREHRSVLEFHYLVATADGVEHFTERHELGLFSRAEVLAACHAAGLDAVFDPEGLIGRGLYMGVRPGGP